MVSTSSDLSDSMPLAFLRPRRIRSFDLILFVIMCVVLFAGAIGLVYILELQPRILEAARDPEGSPATFVTILAVLFLLVLLAAFIAVARHGLTAPWLLGFRHASIEWWLGSMLGMVLLSMFLATIAIPALEHFIGIEGKISTSELVRQILPSRWAAVIATVVIGILAPFTEEFVFRGMLFGWLIGRFPGWVAVVGSAVVFGLAHIQPLHAVMAGCLGLWLGFVRLRAGSIGPCILAHIVNNTVFVWALHLFPTM